jgi:flagellar biosynthesis anti-sigma factor FlgM
MSELKKIASATPGGAVVYEIAPRLRIADRNGPVPLRPDSAGITEGARELARAHAEVDGAREIRSEKVEALRARIASGSYQPDAREIAQAILRRGL